MVSKCKKLSLTIIYDSCVNKNIGKEFENVLLNGVDGTCASLANPRLLEFDLALFVGHKLFSLEVIEVSITKTYLTINQFIVISFIALIELEKDGHLVERYTYSRLYRFKNIFKHFAFQKFRK